MVLHSRGSSSSVSSVATDKRGMSSNNSTSSLHKDDPKSSYGSMLDQLHAEQKGTIEALTCQVEFYRQREERARQELQTLRRCLPMGKGDEAAAVAKLASENRAQGDELDALRAKKINWDRDRARLERAKRELERQLKDAKHTLAGFSQSIEQLEIKMQRKEAEVQTKYLELEQELQDKTLECDQLQQSREVLQLQVENLQTASDENARLRSELQMLLHSAGRSFSEQASSSRFSAEINSIGDKLSSLEGDKRRQETQIQELQRTLVASAAETAAAQLEVERKKSEIKEMQLKLDNSTEMLTVREQLLASDGSSRKEVETQRQELLVLVSTLQREKGELEGEISSLLKEQEATRAELQTAKARLSVKDHTVLVSTLRTEVASLKERLRNEFMHEKDSLKTEAQSLKQELTMLRGRLAEKDLAARKLENELLRGDEKQRQAEYDNRQLREQINRLETELNQSRTKYQQLQQCRTSLVEQLDFGFKELLNDEESAASAHEELEKLRHELARIKKENAVLESERQTMTEDLERVDRLNRESSARQNEKIDELYRHLMEKEEIITSLKSAERQVALLQQEKESWEGNVTDVRLRCESRVESEVRKADGLRSRIEQLEQDKQTLQHRIDDLEEESAKWNEKMHTSELSLRQKDKQIEELKRDLARIEEELANATRSVECGRQDISSREQKLLKERKKMEREMVQLVHRIESAGQRNLELGEKVITLAEQSKVDQTDLVALSSQVKSYKDQVKTLESHLGQIHHRSGQESDTVRDLQRKLGDVTCLKESYQVEINKLRQMLEHVQSDYSVAKKQRDEAVKRVRVLAQCRDDMKATVEDHTAELVEEIEALQHQMDSERKRCAVLLANEKTLLRDLQERNAAISKLQRTVSVLQHQLKDRSSNDRSSSTPRRKSRGSSVAGTPVSSSDQSTVPTSSSPSPHRHHRRHSQPPQQPPQQELRSSPVLSSSCGSSMTPAKEMEHLLSNLERISDFSAHVQQLHP